MSEPVEMDTEALLAQAKEFKDQAMALFENDLRPLFEGKAPQVVSVALMESVATWLAGHVVPGNPEASRAIRTEVARLWVGSMLTLSATKAAEIEAKMSEAGRG
jgi:hypothetical protein